MSRTKDPLRALPPGPILNSLRFNSPTAEAPPHHEYSPYRVTSLLLDFLVSESSLGYEAPVIPTTATHSPTPRYRHYPVD